MLATCECRSKIWGNLPLKKWGPKNWIFEVFSRRRPWFFSNTSGTKQHIHNRDTALQTTMSPLEGAENLVNFGPLTVKNETSMWSYPPRILNVAAKTLFIGSTGKPSLLAGGAVAWLPVT